jgi:hypothetical protein
MMTDIKSAPCVLLGLLAASERVLPSAPLEPKDGADKEVEPAKDRGACSIITDGRQPTAFFSGFQFDGRPLKDAVLLLRHAGIRVRLTKHEVGDA